MTDLPETVEQLLERAGIKARLYSATEDDASPLVETAHCHIFFDTDSVRICYQAEYTIPYDENTLRAILSEFVPNPDDFLGDNGGSDAE